MESIGEKLKTARESKGYSLEQVARDTHIAKRFLSALESEEFSMFPGEPYLMGFLRNYAEYLGLSAHEIVSLYKNLKLQEQPAPIDELLERPRSKMPLIVASIVVVVILAAGTFLLLQSRGGSTGTKSAGQASAAAKEAVNSAKQSSQSGQPATGTVYTFQGGMKEQAFRRGDAITVQSGGKDYRLLLSGIGSTVTLSTPTGVVDIAPNQERSVDLNGNGKPDVKLLVRSISEQDSIPSAVIRIDSAVQGAVASAGNNFSNSATAAQPAGNQAATAPAAEGPAQPAQPAQQPAPQEQQAVAPVAPATGSVIITGAQQQPFTVNFTFTSPALFRYSVDSGQRQERYYDSGETFSTTVASKFELWLSNAAAAQVVVAGSPVTLGASGEVATDTIEWSGTQGNYRLLLVPMN